ncbi:MAG: hypothetical protein ABIG96_04455 [Candidatus Micrarchaeota archaeon]
MPPKIAKELIRSERATYILAEMTNRFNEGELQDAIRTGLVVPLQGNFPRAQ